MTTSAWFERMLYSLAVSRLVQHCKTRPDSSWAIRKSNRGVFWEMQVKFLKLWIHSERKNACVIHFGIRVLYGHTVTPPVSNLLIRSFSWGPSLTPGIPPPFDCRQRRSLSSYCGLRERETERETESVCVWERGGYRLTDSIKTQ